MISYVCTILQKGPKQVDDIQKDYTIIVGLNFFNYWLTQICVVFCHMRQLKK